MAEYLATPVSTVPSARPTGNAAAASSVRARGGGRSCYPLLMQAATAVVGNVCPTLLVIYLALSSSCVRVCCVCVCVFVCMYSSSILACGHRQKEQEGETHPFLLSEYRLEDYPTLF